MRKLFLVTASILVLSLPVKAQTSCSLVSQCPAASVPLSGSEILYIIQGGISKQIAAGALLSVGSSSVTIGTTPIIGGTNGSIEYNNSGVFGELATTGSGNVVRGNSPTLVSPTLGTITSGVWNATAIGYAYGGTGLLALGTANQCLTTNSLVTAMVWASCSSVTNLTIGTTTISGGTNGYVEYNNGGVLGELSTTGSGGVVRATSPTLVTPNLGTVASGTWNGTVIGYAYGGTGLTALGTANQCLTTNSGATAMVWAACSSGAVNLTVGSTTISSGTNGYVEYNNGGVLGEIATTGSGNIVRATSPTITSPTLVAPALGTVASGVWNGTTIGYAYGGTGLTALGTANQCLTTNSGVTAMTWAACTAGANNLIIGTTTITSGTPGDIEYNNSGVLGELATTGSGRVVLATSPTLVTPALGTPSALVLTNATLLPISGITGLGTGVGTALADNAGATGGFAAISGTLTPGDCVTVGVGPTIADAGGACTTGGGGGTVSSGTAGQVTYYASSGTTVVGATTGTGVITAIGNNVNASGGLLTTAITTLGSLTSASTLATIGTIGTGVWHGTVVGYLYGGTGLSALGTSNQCLTTNSGATAMAWANCNSGGTVNSGTGGYLAYYATTGTAVSGATTGAGVLTALGITTGSSGGFASISGTLTSGHCLQAGASGVIVDAGAGCGGSGSGTVNSGTASQFAYYATTGTAVSSMATTNALAGPNVNNVVALGADPTGVSDSSTAFQTALTNARTGGSVYIPCGDYKISSGLSVTISASEGLGIRGGGIDCTSINASSPSTLLSVSLSSESALTIEDLTITTNTATTASTAIYLTNNAPIASPHSTPTTISNVALHGADGYNITDYWGVGIIVNSVSYVNFYGFSVAGNSGGGTIAVDLIGSASGYAVVANFDACTFNGVKAGIYYQNYVQGVAVTNSNFNGFEQNGDYGIEVVGTTGVGQLSVANSQFGQIGIYVPGVIASALITGNLFIVSQVTNAINGEFLESTFHGNYVDSSNASANGFTFTSGSAYNVVTGNVFSDLSGGVVINSGANNNNVLGNNYVNVTTKVSDNGTADVVGCPSGTCP